MFEKKKITTCYTVEKCTSCNKESKRKFKEGDFVFAKSGSCSSCEGQTQIEEIFGETIEQ